MRTRSPRWLYGKWHGLRTLARLRRWLRNGDDVWRCYRAGRPLPPFRFRLGFTLRHEAPDDPVDLLHRIFADAEYRQFVPRVTGLLVDIGANIGAVTLDYVARAPSARAHAYEPDPRSFALLQRNVHDNGLNTRVTLNREGVGAAAGAASLWSGPCSVLATAYGASPPFPDAQRIDMEVVSLDQVVARAAPDCVELLKIDAEGAEVDIVEGAAAPTWQRIRQVIVEYHTGLVAGADTRVREVLQRNGFLLRTRVLTGELGLLYAWK